MLESILSTIKQMLGIPVSDTAFDHEIMVHINSTFMLLNQMGVGPTAVYSISSSSEIWSDFINDVPMYSLVKSYIYHRVKLAFDPPGTSFHINAIEAQIKEFEWRLTIQVPIPPEPEI